MNLNESITQSVREVLRRDRSNYPVYVNRISQLDDPCCRRLYYERTAWDKKSPPDDGLLGTFATGNALEPVIERIVSTLGEASKPQFRIIASQSATTDDLLHMYQISGRIDGLWQTKENGDWQTEGVVDIKTCHPNIFNQLTDYASLSKYPWTQKYRGQLMLYSFAYNLEHCILLFVNKANLYQIKAIPFDLDYGYLETLLQKAETVNKAVDAQEPPAKLNDPDTCPRCPFLSLCCPDFTSKGNLKIEDNEELEAVLYRLNELEPAHAEYKELEKQRDAILVKGRDIVCGPFMVTWTHIEGTRKPSPGGRYEQWRKKIMCVES